MVELGIYHEIYSVIKKGGKRAMSRTCATRHINGGRPYYHLLAQGVKILESAIGKDGVHFKEETDALDCLFGRSV